MQNLNGPLISVLMPTYNSERHIEAAINSLLKSTYTNFELVVSDDCSTDNTVRILEYYSRNDSRIKVFFNGRNLGDYPNRNKAAQLANGKYIKFLDHDDYIYPWGLEIMVKCMEDFPNAGVGLFSLPQNIDSPYPIELGPRECYMYNFFGPGLFHKAPLSSIIRRDVFLACGGFLEKRFVGDFEFWHRVAVKYNFLLISDSLVWYREHENQEGKNVTKGFYEYEIIERNYIIDSQSPLNGDERKKIIRMRYKYWLKHSLLNLIKLRFRSAYYALNKTYVYISA